MELNLLKTAIEEKILQNIPAEIDKKFLNFLDEYKNFFSAIDENNLSQIEIELKFYTPNCTFDTRLILSLKSLPKAEINISNKTLKDFAPSVRVTISVHTYENMERKVRNFYKLGIGIKEIYYTGNIYYIYIIQRLISLDKHFIMEYFL
jgi:hypothetical protein